jgi:hypothetical protein
MVHIGAKLLRADPSVWTEHWGQLATGLLRGNESNLNEIFSATLGAVKGEGLMNILKGVKSSDFYLSADQNCP